MAEMTPSAFCKLFPFHQLTNCELQYELNTTRRNICNRLQDDTLQNYIKNITIDNFLQNDYMNCDYMTVDNFKEMSKCNDSTLSVFHMNIRKFSKHRGEFYAYLKSLVHEFDIIVLSEIGGDASHYLSSILNYYDYVYELPHGNNYGGIVIYSKRGLHSSERNDLRLQKTCNWSSKRPKARVFSDKNIQKFVDELSTVNWNQVLNHNNGNQDCSEFYKYFNRIYCESFPRVQISRKRHKDKPWITKGILISIRHKNRLYKESILNPNDSNIHRYNMYKKSYVTA